MPQHRRVEYHAEMANAVESALAEASARRDLRTRVLSGALVLLLLTTTAMAWRHRAAPPPVALGSPAPPPPAAAKDAAPIVLPQAPPEEVLAVDEKALGVPIYPGAVPTVVTRDTSRGYGRGNLLNVMATSKDPAESVAAYFRKQIGGGARVRRVAGRGSRMAVVEGRRGDRQIRVTLTPGAGRNGPGTIITVTSKRIQR